MLLHEFVDDVYWLDRAGLRECTLAGYRSAWMTHIEPHWSMMDLDNPLSNTELTDWFRSFAQPGAARKTWAVLRGMLRCAVTLGYADPACAILAPELPRQPRYNAETLDPSQIRDLLRGFYGHELEPWLLCSLCLGLRREESCGLRWDDIDLRSGIVHVRRGMQWVNGHMVIDEPKTELSARDVVLPRFAVKRLRQLKSSGYLIGELTPPQVARHYHSWCKRNSLPYVPPKNLRHSWATLALKAGVDISVVSRCLGHASIETTANHYLHPDIGIIRDAQRAFDKLITTAA